MTYSGNPSLSPDIRQRILDTFEQTLQLAGEGSRQEALLGCDFVLRMDPQFEPARVLQDRLKAGSGAVRVDDLRFGAPPASPDADDLFADLDGLSLDLPDLQLGGTANDLRAQFQDLLSRRRFQELMAAAERERSAVMADPELQRLIQIGQERLEAEPYVLKFVGAARQAQQAGQADEVGRLLDKARSLDPGHPGIAELEQARGIRPAAREIQAAEDMQLPSPLEPSAMSGGLAFGGGDSESDRRIQELLEEGQSALASGDPQGAIDAWSRIFLIDIDHQEAARLIEAARKLKAENERQVEEIFHEGLSRLEAGDTARAKNSFERVLEIQPGYFAAREYLQQIEAGAPAPPPRPAVGAPPLRPKAAPAAPVVPLPSEQEVTGRDLKEEILVPPEPSESGARVSPFRPPKPKKAAVAREGRARRLFVMVGAPVLLIVLVAAWFAYQNRDRLFPNSQEEAAPTPAPATAVDPIARAEKSYKEGKTDRAKKQLQLIPEGDPNYARAQKLLAEWEGGQQAPADPAVAETPQAAGEPAALGVSPRREELLTAARQAYADRSYLGAFDRLNQAAAVAKLEGEDAQLLADTKRRLEPISRQVNLFRQREWEIVVPELWRLHEANTSDRDVRQMLVDSYYNMAVKDLQRNDAAKAAEKLSEAAKLQPDDPVLRRNLQFAQTYEQRPKDLLYRIYAKYLPFR